MHKTSVCAIIFRRREAMKLQRSVYEALADRCRNLEESHTRIESRLNEFAEEDGGFFTAEFGWGRIQGNFSRRSPFRSLLESLGHAVHVCRASTEEIVYWNCPAEKLFGWRDYEAMGQKLTQLIISEEYYTCHRKIMATLKSGQSWAGQFPFKNKLGEVFMAIVTKSPLYEDGEFVGIVTVSNDAATFNSVNSENLRRYQHLANGQDRDWEKHLKEIQWQPRNQIASVPQIASSVSKLALDVQTGRCADDKCNVFVIPKNGDIPEAENGDVNLKKLATLAEKVLAKFRIKGTESSRREDEVGAQRYGTNSTSMKNVGNEPEASPSYHCSSSFVSKKAYSSAYQHRTLDTVEENSSVPSIRIPRNSIELPNSAYQFPRLGFQVDGRESVSKVLPMKSFAREKKERRQPDCKLFPSSRESNGSRGSSSSKGENEFVIVNCEVRWEDLHLGEIIGQGTYAIVYRGMWNGSDVGVKVYFWNEYNEGTLEDCKKEIDIMKRLRHPNVLLFMGAVHSHKRLAMVTEYLPRGSLFKTLHKNNHTLDMRRRLLMALDIARGMNYLHRRNPPIVHRDLKSSNLLVDKNWTVKVGDFGMSKLKNGTFLSTKSGKGTPQWMAPEVLRNESSNEKSDVFSFGVVVWELMTECIPWDNLNSLQVVGVVGFMDRRLDIPESIDPQVASIICDCWLSDPGNRPSFEEIIERMNGLVQRSRQS